MLSPCLSEQCSRVPPPTPTLTHHWAVLVSWLKLASIGNICVSYFRTLSPILGHNAAGAVTPFWMHSDSWTKKTLWTHFQPFGDISAQDGECLSCPFIWVLSLVPKGRTGWEDHRGHQSWARSLTRGCGSGRLRIQSHGSAGGSGLLSRFLRVCCHHCAKFLNKTDVGTPINPRPP